MPAETRAGIRRHETKRLRLCRADYFPNINAHGGIDHVYFVHQRNVYTAKGQAPHVIAAGWELWNAFVQHISHCCGREIFVHRQRTRAEAIESDE